MPARSVSPPVWIAVCAALIVAGATVGIHFALGLGRLILNPSHHWQSRSDWTECLIWAAVATAGAGAPIAWSIRNRRRLARSRQEAERLEQERQRRSHQPAPTPSEAPAWKG